MSLVDLRSLTPDLCQVADLGLYFAERQRLAANSLEALFGDDNRLTEAEQRDVQSILSTVARRLVSEARTRESMSRRLGAIVEALIEVTHAIDGDCDLEQQCEDQGAQCDDEGCPDDNGLADPDGIAEQIGSHHLGGGYVL
jgi:hypothetical protein